MNALAWMAGIFVGYRVVRIVARVVLAPLARTWRERPVVMWDDYENRWRASSRVGR